MSRAFVLALVLWGAYGLRLICERTLLPDTTPVPLRVPFSRLPMDVVGPEWRGTFIPLEEDVRKQAHVTDYLQRRYQRQDFSFWLYVGYVGRWSPEAVHHPDVCFPGSGFTLERKESITIPAPGVAPELRFKEFLWRSPRGMGTYTLSSFYYNGKFEPDDWRLRGDSLFGIRYFAIVTVSGDRRESLEETRNVYHEVLRRSIPTLLQHFEPPTS